MSSETFDIFELLKEQYVTRKKLESVPVFGRTDRGQYSIFICRLGPTRLA